MAVGYDDVRILGKVLERRGYGSVAVDSGTLHIEVDWRVDARERAAGQQPVVDGAVGASQCESGPAAARASRPATLYVTAPAVGKLNWHHGAPPVVGQWVESGAVVATVDAGSLETRVVAPSSGRISFAHAFPQGQLVGYAQLLLAIDAV